MSNTNVDQGKTDSITQNLGSDKNAADDTSQAEKEEIKETNTFELQHTYSGQTLYYKMYIFCRELCFVMLLVFTYAAFQNNTPKVSKSPKAFPFFPPGSVVKDWYRGQLSEAIKLAIESDLAFVMYYAPWDAESQAVQHEFNILAQHMHKSVHFFAINCWQPGSECRQQYSKVYSWPVLMAYPVHGPGIHYLGPRTVGHMMKFLQSVINSLTRVTGLVQFSEYRASHEAVIVGYVDPKLGSPEYGILYSTSLKFLERDPMRQIPFLVVTGASTEKSFLKYSVPSLELYLWNATMVYPKERPWSPEAILAWITENLHQVVSWASLPGGKSQSLANYLQPGPALILFTPKNPLYPYIDYYSILHHVALEYYNCHNSKYVNTLKSFILLFQKEYKAKYNNLKDRCLTNKKNFSTIFNYNIYRNWLNSTCDFKKTDKTHSFVYNTDLEICESVIEYSPELLKKELYIVQTQTFAGPPINSKPETPAISMLTGENDPRSPENLQKLAEKEECQFFRMAYKLQTANFAKKNINEDKSNITGLACNTNLTLSFIALDSMQHHHFAEGLGIDILKKEDKSAVVILNPAFESHHVMRSSFTMANLKAFIADFTNGVLMRTLSSTAIQREHTHQYEPQSCCTTRNTSNACVQELTTETFLPTIMHRDKAVVVLYHSIKCAFCSGVAHTFLIVARKLYQVNNLIFSRIDGDSHSLPWEFVMHQYPSILFFPAKRKSESRVFPSNARMTVSNIIGFILANVEPNLKLQLMWALCTDAKHSEDFEKCSRLLRLECISIIGKFLKAYRSSVNIHYRNSIIKNLQILRNLQFALANPSLKDLTVVHNIVNMLSPMEIHRYTKSNTLL